MVFIYCKYGVYESEIYEYQKRDAPSQNDELGKAVFENDFRGVATLLIHHRQLYVAQQTHQYEDTGEIEIGCFELVHHLGRNRIHDVTHQGSRSRNRDGLVDEGEIVANGVLSRSLARFFHPDNIVAPLGKRQEEGEQECHEHNPIT